ncbi:MAG: gliding motility-associated C-terminal domain-containing protein [Saprospiraceae bacterium]|nr:gliding motility-associated C-terminal domain-containing protein [Saprospiraceae bacterium]
MKFRIAFFLLSCISWSRAIGQCPEISQTTSIPNCIPECDACSGEKITIQLTGGDLPNNGKIDYYADKTPGFNPRAGQGTKIGSANITTSNPNCRICPQLLGFMIDACGTEAGNEFLIMWTGSGFNTSNFNFDFAAQNNTGGAQNADIGPGGCSIASGPAGLVGGCSATPVGANFNLPPNAIWIVFTSSNASTNYDFSAICGLSCKIYVSASTCARTIGAFSNWDASPGSRTQVMTITSCGCSTSASYDIPGSLTGNGDFWAEGSISNNGCAVPSLSTPSYTAAVSIVEPFQYTIPQSWCGMDYEIVGIPNPEPDPVCCMDIETERLLVRVRCPVAHSASLAACELSGGLAVFNLEDADADVLSGGLGQVEYFRDMAATLRISSPFTSGNATIYARVVDGKCKSALVSIQLKVNLLPVARAASARECDDGSGSARFDLDRLTGTIKNGNNGTMVRFYLDAGTTQEVSSPFYTSSTQIYATIDDGKCVSKPVVIDLTVLTKPLADSARASACAGPDGKGWFALDDLKAMITKNQPGTSVAFYEDDLLLKRITPPYQTSGDTLFAVVSDGTCLSDPVPVILKIVDLNQVLLLSDRSCADEQGKAIFGLGSASRYLQQGDTSVRVRWYGDSLRMDSLSLPVAIYGKDTLYAFLTKDSCMSRPIPVILEAVLRPTASPAFIRICGDVDGRAAFDLNSLDTQIHGGSGKAVRYAFDSAMTMLAGPLYDGGSDTLFAVILDDPCNSLPARVYLEILPTPQFSFPADSIHCGDFWLLPNFEGEHLSPGAFYSDANGNRISPGDSLISSRWVFLHDPNPDCPVVDSFYIDLLHRPDAGRDVDATVCAGLPVNLFDRLVAADRNGYFIDLDGSGALMDSLVETLGREGSSYRFAYVVPGNSFCPSDTTILSIQIAARLTAGSDHAFVTCEQQTTDLSLLLQMADPGGRFEDPKSTGALQGSLWNAASSGPGTYGVWYIVGDGALCPPDTAVITLEVHPQIVIDPPGPQTHCNFFVLPDIRGVHTGGRSAYFDQPGGGGMPRSAGDTLFVPGTYYIFASEDGYCPDEVAFALTLVQETHTTIDQTGLCPDYFLMVGNERFDSARTAGSVLFPDGSVNGCDSIVEVSLQFIPVPHSILDLVLCPDEYVIVNQQRYDRNRSVGTEVIVHGSIHGCDSMVLINLQFHPEARGSYASRLCEGSTVLLHGVLYDANHLSGIDTLPGAGFFGCDSIVDVTFELIKPGLLYYRNSICPGDTLRLGTAAFHEGNTSLKDTLRSAAANGCDSIRDIAIGILDEPQWALNDTLCESEFRLIQGTRYDINRSSGTERLRGMGANGCDSLVLINLSFRSTVSSHYELSLCPEDSVLLNGKYYSHRIATGIDTLKGQSAGGCDSTVAVQVTPLSISEGRLDTAICESETLTIQGTVYGAGRLTGTERFQRLGSNGCDSLLHVQIKLLPQQISSFEDTLCPGEQVRIGTTLYDANRPVGTEHFSASTGCDSTVNIRLHFPDLRVNYPGEVLFSPGSGQRILLQPQFSPVLVRWEPATGLSCSDCVDPVIQLESDADFTVTLTDANGCEVVLTISVRIFADDRIYVPNAFSPNGDQINDFFRIFAIDEQIVVKEFVIYDRWGNEVYNSESQPMSSHRGWDGTALNGDKMAPGVYLYRVVVEVPGSGSRNIAGDVTLIR